MNSNTTVNLHLRNIRNINNTTDVENLRLKQENINLRAKLATVETDNKIENLPRFRHLMDNDKLNHL